VQVKRFQGYHYRQITKALEGIEDESLMIFVFLSALQVDRRAPKQYGYSPLLTRNLSLTTGTFWRSSTAATAFRAKTRVPACQGSSSTEAENRHECQDFDRSRDLRRSCGSCRLPFAARIPTDLQALPSYVCGGHSRLILVPHTHVLLRCMNQTAAVQPANLHGAQRRMIP